MRSILLGLLALAGTATAASAEDWHIFSRSNNNAFMADVASIAESGGITSLQSAMTPRTGDPGDYSRSVETYQFQCGPKKWRTAGLVEFGPDGAEMERYPEEGAAWESARPGTIPEQLMSIACEGARADPPTWPTINAWIDAGRP